MAAEPDDIAKITHLVLLQGQPLMPAPEQLDQMGDLYKKTTGRSRRRGSGIRCHQVTHAARGMGDLQR
jgi:hypothetical protein